MKSILNACPRPGRTGPLTFLAVLCFVMFLNGCTKIRGASGGAHLWTQPGELRVETWSTPKSLNPLLGTTTSENFLSSLAFDLLVTTDDRGHEIPDLALVVPTLANGGISRDGRTIIYHLRHGVRWQDGAPFTGADVKFSWQAVMNPRNNVDERRGYDIVSSVDTPDRFTAVFHLKSPFSPFVDTVFGESDDPYRIVPKHILEKYADINRVPFNSQPIGTGPFRVEKWIQGESIQYVANDSYFRGKPHLRRITVRFVSDDNTREADLRSHSSDLANDIAATSIRDMRGDPEVRTVLTRGPVYTSLDMNLTHAALGDVRVRRAIARAINVKEIVRDDTYGTAEPATEDLSAFYWAYDPSITRPEPDIARAQALLQSAGWLPGRDGIRVKAGVPLVLQLVYQLGQPAYRVASVQLQSELRRAGIDVRIRALNPTLLYATKQLGGVLTGGDYDLVIYPWIAGADPDDSQQWMCEFIPPNGNNITHYCSAAFDAAERSALTHFDRASRAAAYKTTQRLLASDVPAIFLYYPKRLYALNPDLKGFSPNGVSEGWNASEWSI